MACPGSSARRAPAALGLILGAAALLTTVTGSPLLEAVSCHVCGPPDPGSSPGLFPGQPPPPACDQDELGPASIRKCPPGHKGCLATYNGTVVTRSCHKDALHDCNVANRVLYCMCTGPVCNRQAADDLDAELQDQLSRARERQGCAGPGCEDADDFGREGSGSSEQVDAEEGDDDAADDLGGSTSTSTTSRSTDGGGGGSSSSGSSSSASSGSSSSSTTSSATSTTSTTGPGDFYMHEQDTDAPGTSKDAASSSTTTDSRGEAPGAAAAEESGKGAAGALRAALVLVLAAATTALRTQ